MMRWPGKGDGKHERPPAQDGDAREERLNRAFDPEPPPAPDDEPPKVKPAPACQGCGSYLDDHSKNPRCLWLKCPRPVCGAVFDTVHERWIAGHEAPQP
jgi:hypothetical protein